MSTNLVTIATFDQAAKARLAQNVLQAAGIRAAVSDETVVAMDWLLANAVGGVKVQVWEADAERAVAELEQAFGHDGAGFGSVSQDDLAAEAEAALREEGEEPPVEAFAGPAARPDHPPSASVNEDSADVLTEREQYARRAYFSALFGLVVPLLLFYAVYLLLVTWSADGDLKARGRRQAMWASTMTFFGLLAWWGWMIFFPFAFLDIF